MTILRVVMFVFLISLASLSWSDNIKCYSGGKEIYSDTAKDILFENGLFAFKDKNNHLIFVNGECIVDIAIPVHHKKKKASK